MPRFRRLWLRGGAPVSPLNAQALREEQGALWAYGKMVLCAKLTRYSLLAPAKPSFEITYVWITSLRMDAASGRCLFA